MFAVIIDALSFLATKVLPWLGIAAVGDWAVHKYVGKSSSSTGGTGPTLLGTANLWAWAGIAIGAAAVIYQYEKNKGGR